MTVEEFLENSAYGWEAAGKLPELQQAYADADTMDAYAWVSKWAPVIMDTPELTADFYDSKLLETTKSLPERLVKTFGTSDRENPFKKSDKWINQLYHSEFSDVPREKFDKTVSDMAKYWEDEKKARSYEAGKKRREKEVKEEWTLSRSPARALLASEYEKQRYINEPEAAIFGKEAGTGPIWTKPEATSDLIFGISGAVADAIPGYGTILGPAVRGLRDVRHKTWGDSPYQGTWGDIAGSFVGDVATSAFIEGLPNLRQFTRLGKNVSKGPVRETMALEDEVRNITKGKEDIMGILSDAEKTGAERQVALREYYANSMPESALKTELGELMGKQAIDMQAVYNTVRKADFRARSMLNPEYRKVLSGASEARMAAPTTTYAPVIDELDNWVANGVSIDQIGRAAQQYLPDGPAKESILNAVESGNMRNVQIAIRGNKDASSIVSDLNGLLETPNNMAAVRAYVNTLPDGEIKYTLLQSLETPNATQGSVRKALADVAMPKSTELDAFTRRYIGLPELTKTQKAAKGAVRMSEQLLGSNVGNTLLKEAATANFTPLPGLGKRPRTSVETDPQSTIDWYKANYARDFEMGFKPSMKEGDPKWEAYSQWYFEKYGKMPEGSEGGNTWINIEDVEVK